MNIIQAKQTSDSNWVRLTFDDGSTGQVSVEDGIRRQYTDLFNDYLANGGVVEPEFTQAELAAQAEAKRVQAIKDSCRSQIYAMYDAEDQMNMTSELAILLADNPTSQRCLDLRGVRDWIINMVTTSRTAVADGVTLEQDIVWPTHVRINI